MDSPRDLEHKAPEPEESMMPPFEDASESQSQLNETPNVDQPNVEEPNVEELNVEEPSVGEPNVEEPNVEEPSVEEPSVGEPSVGEPNIEEPNVEEPDVEKPDVEKPDVEKIDVEKPDVEKIDVEKPDVEKPDVEKPDVEMPDVEKPDVEQPDVEQPDVEVPDNIDLSMLEGKKVNKVGNITDENGKLLGRIVEGVTSKLVGKKCDAEGKIWSDGKVIGRAEIIPHDEREEDSGAPFEDFPDAVVDSDGNVNFEGQIVGKLVEGDAKKLAGKKVDKDGDVLDKIGNVLGKAERWTKPDEPEPEAVDMSILAGKRVR